MNASIDVPPTNMEIMTRLTRNVVHAVTQHAGVAPQDTCEIQFVRKEGVEFLEHSFIETLRRLCASVRTASLGSDEAIAFDILPSRAEVVYEKTFRDGLFGENKAVRLVSVEFSAQVTNKTEGKVVFGGTLKEQLRDTVPLNSIERLESPILKVTQAHLPTGSVFDKFVEPFVVLAATGVVIYLFFTVRS